MENNERFKLETKISDWCEKENMPSHWTVYELLNPGTIGMTKKLTSDQRDQLELFQEQLEQLEKGENGKTFLCKEGNETFTIKAQNQKDAEGQCEFWNAVVIREIAPSMTKEKFVWYKNETHRLKEVDKQITLKVQHRLNVMDQLETIAQKPHVIFDLDESDDAHYNW